ncbi:MAG: DUF3089 domain-containing protein [Cryomorphaceae bacterium]|jgi:hypothetical protein|nr:DUF3089 domain-containing protein [Cryomorphaceae bacterium]MDG1889378.1 DUF3089 domain-containing protein [Flavobacteriaceae bacterium]MBT3502915.1 DUF3089 domain-containing protein [Cryomorphaceae bacterium]MBT3688690.1 DUF3089 domain-containing protein [Cryomorphaceae bacterium]MBT4222563.1 DUF3089 domain-containing protein [Cryomorphaceae bacterium]|tara:strand:+ start:2176 stop:3195 length:1020 start_codon:yes stop_codon:yes gene_type:complete
MFKRNVLKVYVLLWFITGCKISYNTYDFEKSPEIAKPNYSENDSWAVLPDNFPDEISQFKIDGEKKEADVFFIYPTLIDARNQREWNSDIWNKEIREDVINRPIKYQASAWIDAGNLYVPFYRQAHIRVFNEKFKVEGKKALDLAYSDIKEAFTYYLKNFNNNKPFIIASHSQGTVHAKRIISEFIDGKELQKKLIAAYLVGIKVTEDEFDNIKPMNSPDEIGGFVSWNTFKFNKYPKEDNYERWFKGGVTSNPITWDDSKETKKESHKGVLYRDLTIFPKNINIKLVDGIVWSSLPNIPGKFFLRPVRSYHFADINLFWVDIRENAKLRVEQWFKKNN